MYKKIFLSIYSIIWLGQSALAQEMEISYVDRTVTKNGQASKYGFAGGLNSGQYQTIDFDGDDDLDLVVFDRTSNQLNCFENTGSDYQYAPQFQYYFPKDIVSWLVLVDYDCDGDQDLFTASNLGVKVYRNNFDQNLQWELIADPLMTLGTSMTNLFFNRTDIPSIADQDGDGDLDFLVFYFAGGERIEFHKNYSVENTGACGLDFVVESRHYAGISECGCGTIVFNDDCPTSGRVTHIGAKALLSYDHDQDGDMDLVFNQEDCSNLEFMENKGTNVAPSFDSFRSDFPTFGNELDYTIFPAAYRADVTFDGQADIIVAPNERHNGGNSIDFKQSSLLYVNSPTPENTYSLSSSAFLQEDMIDVGEFAYPAFADVDGDGQQDLVIGNRGSRINSNFLSTLTYLRRSPQGYDWQTDDAFGFASHGFVNVIPQFLDWNGDGRIDLIISASDNTFNSSLYLLLNTGSTEMQFDPANRINLNQVLSMSEDFQCVDINQDGAYDLLVGESSGRLNYYRNEGTNDNPNFIIADESFLDLDFSSDRTNLFLTVGDLDQNGLPDLIVTDGSGGARLFQNMTQLGSDPVSELVFNETAGPVRFGRQSKPAIGPGGLLAIGSIQGGVQLAKMEAFSTPDQVTFSVYPVPDSDSQSINFITNTSGFELEILSLAGQKIYHEIELVANQVASIDKSYFDPGIYISRITNGGTSISQKFIIK